MRERRSSAAEKLIDSLPGRSDPSPAWSAWLRILTMAGLLGLVLYRLGELIDRDRGSILAALENAFGRWVDWLQAFYRGS